MGAAALKDAARRKRGGLTAVLDRGSAHRRQKVRPRRRNGPVQPNKETSLVSVPRLLHSLTDTTPPRVVRGSARQAAIASSVNQIVKLPRWRRAASYSDQFVTRCCCFGMWWRRSALTLNGMAYIGSQGRRQRPAMWDCIAAAEALRLATLTSAKDPLRKEAGPPPTDPCNKVAADRVSPGFRRAFAPWPGL